MLKYSQFGKEYFLTEIDKDIEKLKNKHESSYLLEQAKGHIESLISNLEEYEAKFDFLDKCFKDGIDCLFETKDKIIETFEKAGLDDAENHFIECIEDFTEDGMYVSADRLANDYFNLEYEEIEKELKEGGFIYRIHNELGHLNHSEMLTLIYNISWVTGDIFECETNDEMLDRFKKLGETSQKILLDSFKNNLCWTVVNRIPTKDDFDKMHEIANYRGNPEYEVGYSKLEDGWYVVGMKERWDIDLDFRSEKEIINKDRRER